MENEQHRQHSRAVIAGVLDFPALMDDMTIGTLEASFFFGGDMVLWQKMRELHKTSSISVVNLINSLSPSSGYDFNYFAKLLDEIGNLPQSDIIDYARGLANHAGRRSLNEIAGKLAQAARSDEAPAVVAAQMMDDLARWAMHGELLTDEPIRDVLSAVFDEAMKRYADPRDIWGIPSGFRRLDLATGGLQTGELIIIGGEPGVGKTWFSTQLAMQAAESAPGVFLSLEMRKADIVRRMMGVVGVQRQKLMTGRLEPNDFQLIDRAMAIIQNLPIVIDDRPIKLHQIRPVLARHKTKTGASWFVLDYLYLIDAPGRDEIEKTQNISREMKLICKELNMAGIVLHSVIKSGMDQDGTAKSKLRGSGQVVHDADVIYMLTKYQPAHGNMEDAMILPARAARMITLHVEKGRELERSGGVIHYERRQNSPGFDELVAKTK